MKKIFTLVAMAFVAVCANAQTWKVTEDASFSDGQEITDVSDCKLTFGIDKKKWTVKADTSVKPFTAYVSGGNNPKDDNAKGYSRSNLNNPTNGGYFVFSPAKAGKLTVGIVVNAGKNFYITDKDGNCLNEKASFVDKTGAAVKLSSDDTFDSKLYGKVTFEVEAGNEYYVFTTGSKIGLYGFIFPDDGTTGINAISNESNENAPVYNIAGQKVSKNAKGVLIQNGKKFINK